MFISAGVHTLAPLIPLTSLVDAASALAARPYARRGTPIPQSPIRVVLVDDHTIFRVALRSLLERTAPDILVVAEASNGNDAVELVGTYTPDVLVMDLDMAGGDGLTALRALRDTASATKVLILSMHTEEERLLLLLRAGANGYVAKDVAERELVDAIRVVAAGDTYVRPRVARALAKGEVSRSTEASRSASASELFMKLSERERTVLGLVAHGFNGPEIGEQLGITAKTVDTYKQRIEGKLGLAHRTAYVRFALDAGLLDR